MSSKSKSAREFASWKLTVSHACGHVGTVYANADTEGQARRKLARCESQVCTPCLSREPEGRHLPAEISRIHAAQEEWRTAHPDRALSMSSEEEAARRMQGGTS